MDSSNIVRPSLPPIHSLDMDKYHREESDYQRRHADAPLPVPLSTVTAAAPSPYPSGPPPPYSAASHAPSTTATHGPPSDRRIYSMDERESNRQQPKQSLPSLHEALGVEQHAATSASDSARPPLTVEAPHPNAYVSTPAPASTHTPYSRSHRGSISYERRSSDHDTTPYGRHYLQHSPITASSQREARPYSPSERHRQYERPPQPPAPSSNFSFGYAPYPPRFPSSTSAVPPPTSQPASLPHASSAASIYQPSVSHPPPAPRSAWHSEMAPSHTRAPAVPESATAVYGESVKRHLDMYDFELALNEILDHSTVMCDFSRAYGARLHQNARTGPAPGTLPAITEVEELMNKSRFTLEALGRMREVLIAQEAAYLQQAQEQRFQSEAEAEAKRNDSVHVSDEGKGGFAGPEPKKRRGRAAAPGRCHSCNRAETPEWRRGPDGARTLCNACGLHYAKLTRKAGANKAAVGSSNLRPKSSERDIPASQ